MTLLLKFFLVLAKETISDAKHWLSGDGMGNMLKIPPSPIDQFTPKYSPEVRSERKEEIGVILFTLELIT